MVKVIRDVVKRYNVDALHFDDYFYPYRIPKVEFPDGKTFAKYGKGLTRDEWRRSNVDSIIVKLSRAIKEEKPYCQFGISPFGVWRNKDKDSLGSDTKAGQTNYDDLYADILLWLREGHIDYVVPQLYWEHGHRLAPYEVLLEWWANNSFGKHCYVGLGVYKAGTNTRWKDTNIIPEQIRDARKYHTIHGEVYFSSKSFVGNPNGWNDSLRNNYYKEQALIPPMKWIDSIAPAAPEITSLDYILEQEVELKIAGTEKSKQIRKAAIYVFNCPDKLDVTEKRPFRIVPMMENKISYKALLADLVQRAGAENSLYIAVTTIDQNNLESAVSNIKEFHRNQESGKWELVW